LGRHLQNQNLDINVVDVSFPAPHNSTMSLADIKFASGSRIPVWVFNIDTARIIWANDEALKLWRASSVKDLSGRDLGKDMSPTVSARLKQFQNDFLTGSVFDEIWTVYPEGIAKTLACRFRGCLLPNGTMAMLCEGEDITEESPELIKAAQALIYTGVSVTSYREDGTCQYANPAARRIFPASAIDIADRILCVTLRDRLLQGIDVSAEGSWLARVNTNLGERLHQIEIKVSYDATSGEKAWLLTESDVTLAEKTKQKLQHLATHDPLTDLKNRNYLNTHAADFIQSVAAENAEVSMCLLDLDRFKYVNDTLGHTAGDQLLKELAVRLEKAVPNGSIVARLGGDEFCFLIDSRIITGCFCDILFAEVNKPFVIQGHSLRLNASFGFSETTPDMRDFETLLQQADLALYDAKRESSNTCRSFEPEMAEKSQKFLILDNKIKNALSKNHLELKFFPQVSLSSDRIVGAEASCWIHLPNGDFLLPDDYMHIAEATGAIIQIGNWALKSAVQMVTKLRALNCYTPISVKIAPIQLQNAQLLTQLRRLASEPGFLPSALELEIPESILLTQDARLQDTVKTIADLGYGIVVRDFGTAYSSISNLQFFPFNCLKLDRQLVTDSKIKSLTMTVISMAQALGLRVCADGVETEDQKRWLKESGCDLYQGNPLVEPLSFAQFCDYLHKGKARK